jgi:hypothetical protein
VHRADLSVLGIGSGVAISIINSSSCVRTGGDDASVLCRSML